MFKTTSDILNPSTKGSLISQIYQAKGTRSVSMCEEGREGCRAR